MYILTIFSSPDLASQLIDKKTYCGATVRAARKNIQFLIPTRCKNLTRGEDISEVRNKCL